MVGVSRLQSVRMPARAEPVALLLAGAAAGCLSCLVRLHLGIPGHAILRAMVPIALGLALVPRRGAGSLMGAGALTAALAAGGGGIGATTSLLLLGPAIDVALSRGRHVYLALVLAGVASNLVAFAVRGNWTPLSAVTYPVCGALAGLVAAAALFRYHDDLRRD